MTQAELEAELTGLKAEVDQLRARDERRVAQSRSLVRATTLIGIFFAVVYLGFVVASAWTGRHGLALMASPILFASIALSFVSQALGVWRIEANGLARR
jgi:hypothetical protein